jgi:hypothetical protein
MIIKRKDWNEDGQMERKFIIIEHDNHVTLLATIYLRANTTHVFIFTTCFGCDAPSSGEAETIHQIISRY